ncbi:MAG: sigma-54-dependent Fis family transcriptional regulator [Magnetococcales bacterium]|nr:sigma-54-dependent Fis family transcriptional regulator [Magnetococcales bacterium]
MGEALHILVVDDEPAIRQVLVATLQKAGYTAEHASNASEGLKRIGGGEFDVVISDINMPGMSGIEMVRQAKEAGTETVFLMMTAFASVDTALEAMKAGAYDYLIKPLRKEDILLRLTRIANVIGLQDQNRALRNMVQEGEVGKCRNVSNSMAEIERLIRKVANTDYTVLITGESGTGKGVIARQIHRMSQRGESLFIPVNCGSIPENLLESEFFGHTRGAFTGADKGKKGLFVEADKGCLFLDEIGELPLHLQVKLLHVLEEKQIRPVGSERFRKVDVRIIAATNRNLREMAAQGTFREDLFFRLNVFNIHMPPLRERREDILPLLRFFVDRYGKRLGENVHYKVDPEAEQVIMAYDWPGNVRELENTVERALILAESGEITLDDLPPHIANTARLGDPVDVPVGGTLREQLRAYEIRIIQESIRDADGDRRLAARRLGIGLSSLYRKLDQSITDG